MACSNGDLYYKVVLMLATVSVVIQVREMKGICHFLLQGTPTLLPLSVKVQVYGGWLYYGRDGEESFKGEGGGRRRGAKL